MRIRQLILIHFLILPAFAIAQLKIDTIKSHDRPDELYFPLIRHPKASVAQKINDYLQSNLLKNTTKKTPASKLFDRTKFVQSDTAMNTGTSASDFEVLFNSPKLLSIRVDIEYMAAYPSTSSHYFNFNAQNGELIFVEDLFTTNGLEALKKKINVERGKKIKQYTKDISEDKTHEFHDDLNYINEQLTQCLEYDILRGFAILKGKIVFYKSNCFPHVVQNYMPNLDIVLSLADLNNWLNDYGKKALLIKTASIEKENKPGLLKPFFGTIDGKYPIVLQFDYIYDGKSISGFYYYASQGISISLSGSIAGQDVFIEEQDDESNTTATFRGTYKGNQISGTWTSKKTGKPLPFLLKNGMNAVK